MNPNVAEWVNLIFRWAHVFSAILWVGTTYYFTWLDRQLQRGGDVWMVHSGGFYTVVKQKTLGVPPERIHWFRYEALATFVTGFCLLGVVYYSSGGMMTDPIRAAVSNGAAIGIGIMTLIVGWTVYDLVTRVIKNDTVFAVVGFLLIVLTAFLLRGYMSGRATYIHIGALFGTIMVSNVWMRILPPQRRMIATLAKGGAIDEAKAAAARRRTKHNTFLVIPTVALMVSNHFPTATYGNHYAVPILGGLVLAGWAAAAMLRKA